jgi:UDP-glucose 4-epimerase
VRVLITGGTGFLGGKMALELQNRGKEIILIKREQWDGSDKYSYLKTLLSDKKDTTFVHLSAIADMRVCESDFELCNKVNIEQLSNLLNYLSDSPVSNFIFASSMAVYGDTGNEVKSESDEAGFNSKYGESKLAGEKLLRDWSIKNNKTVFAFRIANLYGFRADGRVHDKGVLSYLIKELLKGDSISIEISKDTHLSAKRDFINVDDCVDLLLRGVYFREFIESHTLYEKKLNCFNIAKGEGDEISAIAIFLAQYLNFKGFINLKISDKVSNGVGSNAKTSEVFNWVITHKLYDDLRDIVESYKLECYNKS